MIVKLKNFWRLLCYSLGEKSGKNNKESDIIAVIRLLFVLQVIITNSFIVLGVIRHYNGEATIQKCFYLNKNEISNSEL